MLYYFKKVKNATKRKKKKICAVHGEDAVTDQTRQMWFMKFCAGDLLVDDAPWSGRSVEVDGDQIETLFENNERFTTREIAYILKNIQGNKVIGENKKCLLFYRKNNMNFLADLIPI